MTKPQISKVLLCLIAALSVWSVSAGSVSAEQGSRKSKRAERAEAAAAKRADTKTATNAKVDLNTELVKTGFLGTPKLQKVALAHPRSIAITNNGDANDGDESLYVTEFFSQATAPEAANGSNSDTRRTGIVYRVKVSDKSGQLHVKELVDRILSGD